MILFVIITIAIVLLLIAFKIKHGIKSGSLTIVTGGVKTGKSTLSVYICISKMRARRFVWKYLKCPWAKLRLKPIPEEPLLYSNVPIKVPYYVPITEELILRKKRFNYKSGIYLQEASLVADSMCTYNYELNEATLLLFKLIAHETKGGFLLADTQCMTDVHYNLKRSISTYLYVHKIFRWCPFLLFVKVQEKFFDAVNTVNVNVEGDVDNMKYKWVILPKKTWKRFDRYCYSVLTDPLPRYGEEAKGKPASLKADKIITFRKGETKKCASDKDLTKYYGRS